MIVCKKTVKGFGPEAKDVLEIFDNRSINKRRKMIWQITH